MSFLSFFLFLFLLKIHLYESAPSLVIDNNDISKAEEFLGKFAHYRKPKNTDGSFRKHPTLTNEFKDALKIMQKYAGLKETGELNEETIKKMSQSRCGIADGDEKEKKSRKKRYSVDYDKWEKLTLTYRIDENGYSNDLLKHEIDSSLENALLMWSNVSPLKFQRIINANQFVDIDILFTVGDHGDGLPFGDQSIIIAHAFYPETPNAGDVHFNDAANFTKANGMNLFQIATHEFGHSLGLHHSQIPSAVMTPYFEYRNNFQLDIDDIEGIQYIYGKPEPTTTTSVNELLTNSEPSGSGETTSDSTTTPTTTTTQLPMFNMCDNSKIDASFKSHDHKTYIFQGIYFWVLSESGQMLPGYPKQIGHYFINLETHLDAAFHWPPTRITYFFKKEKYWAFDDDHIMLSGYPKLIGIDGFINLPTHIDSAFVYTGNGLPIFTKGPYYYKLEGNQVDLEYYPKSISMAFSGLPNHIDAAMTFMTGENYFFTGSDYYRFDDYYQETYPEYPKDIGSNWFGCNAPMKTKPNLRPERPSGPGFKPIEMAEKKIFDKQRIIDMQNRVVFEKEIKIMNLSNGGQRNVVFTNYFSLVFGLVVVDVVVYLQFIT